MKKRIFYGILMILATTSFIFFGIQLNELIEDTTTIVTIADSVYVDDSSIGMETDSDGTSFEGSIAFFESNILYDTIYDDDTTGDGYRDRRSYYLGNDMVFASWDENADSNYETSMNIVDGMYVDSLISDMNNDGIIDTLTTFSNDGEEIFKESDLMDAQNVDLITKQYARELSSGTILWLALPLILGFIFLGTLLISLVKNKRANRITSFLLCLTMFVFTLAPPVYASDIYNDDGSVNSEVFENDWKKYSDIDDRIPLEQRSYEAMEYGKAEQEIQKLYSLMYNIVANKELNRLNYIDLVDYKKAVDTTQKKNLIKSTIRLAAFTGYTIKDSIGKGKTFAENILKSGATLVTQIGDVLTVTSDFVTDSYKESFGILQKAYDYTTSGDIFNAIKEDIKENVKDQVSIKINDTIDEAIGRKRIPDYTVDDLKITDDDIKILKSHYDKSREIDNAILQNRKINIEYDNKINDIAWQILSEMNKLDEFRTAEKDRVFYVLSQKSPEKDEEDEGGEIGDEEDAGFFSADYSGETDDSWLDDVEIEESAEEYNTEQLVGVWKGTWTLMDFNVSTTAVLTDEERAEIDQLIGKVVDVYINIYKEGDVYIFKEGDLFMEIERSGNNIRASEYIEEMQDDYVANLAGDSIGYVNDMNNEMTLDTLIRANGNSEAGSLSIEFTKRMVLFKE